MARSHKQWPTLKKSLILLIISMTLFPSIHADSVNYAKKFAEFLRDIHPSFLGAVGTGEQLARHAPTIMTRLRETRQAIQSLGQDYIPDQRVSTAQEYSFIQDPEDRRAFIRHLNDLSYLVALLENAWNDEERQERANAIEQKLQAIESLYVKWTGRPAPPAEQFKPNFTKIWSSNPATYGEIHWTEGWYGNSNKTITITNQYWDDDQGRYMVEGDWGRANDAKRHGGFTFTFDSPCSFSGNWWYSGSKEKTQTWSGKCQ